MTKNGNRKLRIHSWKERAEASKALVQAAVPKISLARPWNPETEKLLIGLWDSHDPAQIAEAVNLWHKNYARSKGRIWWQGTSDAGVMYRAAKLGLITTQKSSLFHRRVKKLRARAHYINPKLRCAVLERDGQKCLLCGALENLETDHIIPVTDGGKSEIENLQTLCRGCHRTHKGTLHVDFRRPFIKEHCKACHLDHYKNI